MQTNFPLFLSKYELSKSELLSELLLYLRPGKLNNEKQSLLRLGIIEFLGEFCIDIFSTRGSVLNALGHLFDNFISNADTTADILGACFTTCTAICVSLKDMWKSLERSNSAQNSDPTKMGNEFENRLVQTIVKFLTHHFKVGNFLENCLLHCLLELERNIPCILHCYLNIFYESLKSYQGINKQLWNNLLLLGTRNLLKCIVKHGKASQKSVSSIILRGVSLPASYLKLTEKEDLKEYYSLFDQKESFTDSNSDINALCDFIFQYMFNMEPVVQVQTACYLCEIRYLYRSLDDSFLTTEVLQFANKTSLCLSIASLTLFRHCHMPDNSSLSKQVLKNLGEGSQMVYRAPSFNVYFLKATNCVANASKLSLPSKYLRLRIIDANAVLFEKVCLFLNTHSQISKEMPFEICKFLKLFQKQIDDSEQQTFVCQALFRALFLTLLLFPSSEEIVHSIVNQINMRHSFMSSLVSNFLISLSMLNPETKLPQKCLNTFCDSLTSDKSEWFSTHFEEYLPLMSLVAKKSQADLSGYLEILESVLMQSDICITGSLSVGEGLIEIIRNLLQYQPVKMYFTETTTLLENISQNFNNDLVQQSALFYLRLQTSLSGEKLRDFLSNLSVQKTQVKSYFVSLLDDEGIDDVNDNATEGPMLSEASIETIVYCKLSPCELPSMDTYAAVQTTVPSISSFENTVSIDSYLSFEYKPKAIQIYLEISIAEKQKTQLHAIELLMKSPEDNGLKIAAPIFINYLEQDKRESVNIVFEVSRISTPILPLYALYNEDINTCSCALNSLQIEFHDFFLPFYCSVDQRPSLFSALWKYYKDMIQLTGHETAVDIIHNVDFGESMERLQRVLSRFIPPECFVQCHNSSDFSFFPGETVLVGIYLPPGEHVLMRITLFSATVVLHCVLSSNHLCEFFNPFLTSLQSAFKYS